MALFLDFIVTAGITMTIIILFLIVKQKNKQLPHTVLLTYFTILLFVSLNLYADLHQLDILFFISYVPHDIARWLLGPLLFLYIKSLFHKKAQLIRDTGLHFVPVLFYMLIISVPILISIIMEKPVFGYLEKYSEYSPRIVDLSNVYTLFYFFLSYRVLPKYIKGIKANYSNLTKNDLEWVNRILIGGSFVIGLDITLNSYQIFFGNLGMDSGVFTLMGVIFLIGYLGYYGIHQSSVLLPDFLLEEGSISPLKENKSSFRTSVDRTELLALEKQIEYLLGTKKMYLDEELTLIKLAEQIPISDKKLSALLNNHMMVSFYDIINGYRVKAVKEKIDSGAHENLSLLGIAYECGFRSKASFNRIFKKETGLSPSQYKNRHKKD